jgi:polysaccharide biosynthesis protein PslF
VRVLMVCPSYQPQRVACGVGDYTARLAEEIAAQGEDVSVLCSTAYEGAAGGLVRVRPEVDRWSLRVARDVVERGMRERDVLHVQYTPVLYGPRSGFRLVTALARLRRVPTVVTFHTLTGASRWSAAWAVVLLASARVSIAANAEVEDVVRRRAPRLARRLRAIHIGANLEPHGPADTERARGRALLGVPSTTPLLVHFGLLYPGKGVETLLDALARLHADQPAARLALIGDTPPEHASYRQGLERFARARGVGDAVIWTGRRSDRDASAMLAAADVFVVPYDDGASRRRGSLLAGLVHGLPIVSTTPSADAGAFRDGEPLALVPPRDPAALAARVAALLAAPEERRRLGLAARALAKGFAWPAIADETRRAYADAVAS